MVSALGSLASPTSCCHHRRGGAGGAGISPRSAFDPGIPGPSPTQVPGPLGPAGQASSLILSTSGFRDPSTFLRSQGF